MPVNCAQRTCKQSSASKQSSSSILCWLNPSSGYSSQESPTQVLNSSRSTQSTQDFGSDRVTLDSMGGTISKLRSSFMKSLSSACYLRLDVTDLASYLSKMSNQGLFRRFQQLILLSNFDSRALMCFPACISSRPVVKISSQFHLLRNLEFPRNPARRLRTR